MRTLNDYFIDGGSLSDIGTADRASPIVTVPDDGRLNAVAVGIRTAATTAVVTTFDVFKNSVDTGVDLSIPASMAVNTGAVGTLDGNVDVVAGDMLHLVTNGETGNAPTGYFNWVIRR